MMPHPDGELPIPYSKASLSSAVYGGPDREHPAQTQGTFQTRPRGKRSTKPSPPAGPAPSSFSRRNSDASRRATVLASHAGTKRESAPQSQRSNPATVSVSSPAISRGSAAGSRAGCAFAASFAGSCPKLSDFETTR